MDSLGGDIEIGSVQEPGHSKIVLSGEITTNDANYNSGVGITGTYMIQDQSGSYVPLNFINGLLCTLNISSGSSGYISGSTTPTSGSGPDQFSFITGQQGWNFLGTTSPGTIDPGTYGTWSAGGLNIVSANGQVGYGSTSNWGYETSASSAKVSVGASIDYSISYNFTSFSEAQIYFAFDYGGELYNVVSAIKDTTGTDTFSGTMSIPTPGGDHDIAGKAILNFQVTTSNNTGDTATLTYIKLNGVYAA
jgi:hypothetical protein